MCLFVCDYDGECEISSYSIIEICHASEEVEEENTKVRISESELCNPFNMTTLVEALDSDSQVLRTILEDLLRLLRELRSE